MQLSSPFEHLVLSTSFLLLETLTPEDHEVWHATLGLEGGEAHMMATSCPMTFEIICRLLYIQRPQSLVCQNENL